MTKVSFHPNPSGLTYTASGKEAEKASKAKMGLVTHIRYHGSSLTNMSASHDVNHENFKHHPDVYHIDHRTDTSKAHYSPEAQKEFHHHMAAAKAIHDKHGKEMYPATEKHQGVGGHLETYINHTVRTGERPSVHGLIAHIKAKHEKKMETYRTPERREAVKAEVKHHVDHINAHHEHYQHLLDMHHHLQQAKNVLTHTLNQHQDYEHSHAGEKANPEGYVIHTKQGPSKLVLRHEFSRRNLLGQRAR